jgi:hypothetical protein
MSGWKSTRDRALSTDGGPMWFSKWSNGWHNWRPDGAIRGKWRILDEKDDEWSDLIFGAPRL